jgi:uncharacterized protein (DUF433 family)
MSNSVVVSLRLPQDEATRLKQIARRRGRTPSEVGAEMVSESLRRTEFTFIDFRDTAAGRQAFIQGTRVTVWQVIAILRDYEGEVSKAAKHLEWPVQKVHAAIAYAEAFPGEIEEALEDQASYDFKKLSRLLPGIELVEVPVRSPRKK